MLYCHGLESQDFTDINNLSNSATKHGQCEERIRNCLAFVRALPGSTRNGTFFSNAKDAHNRKFVNNTVVLWANKMCHPFKTRVIPLKFAIS